MEENVILEDQETVEHFEVLSGCREVSVSPPLTSAEYTIHSSLGKPYSRSKCSCGECIAGFLSPRMRVFLEWHANRWWCFLRDNIEEGEAWTRLNAENLIFASPELRLELAQRRAMREGFAGISGFIAACLSCNTIPTEENVKKAIYTEEFPQICLDYISRGGTISPVASIIFKEASSENNWLDYDLFQTEYEETMMQLPECRNDGEFTFLFDIAFHNTLYNVIPKPRCCSNLKHK
ncbi:hypothetical protein BDV37DRAFT_277279 [Aspergillus pseudonomiae]|uniref:Uncharacterized protein n=1 Tax=Aspergillus pseudonomiae TaxID=1506151 RepID=A0A5N7CS50_9EURO|nr:uncharacterized protein BDV37DRAFT_277279 [Aspergillus pseudonomiae]KAE8396965.1 hypothetical protein BDV37DRAFT_277279 [Aspergillus pseudonomiae]